MTDPPYGLSFMAHDWDMDVPGPEFWAAFFDAAKPGAHLAAFGGTRTHHHLWLAIERAGWEIRDTLFWLYGSGFPKNRQIDGGRGTALKPAVEPICLARKPFAGSVAGNVARCGTGALNIDACRVGEHNRYPANLVFDVEAAAMLDAQTGVLRSGYSAGFVGDVHDSVALGAKRRMIKPGATYADEGGASRFFAQAGYDHEALEAFERFCYAGKASRTERELGLDHLPERVVNDGRKTAIDNPYQRGDSLRRNVHPAVKPLRLLRWLVRLMTPPGGLVFDGFMGSGSTGCAAALEGARFMGCDNEPEYLPIAQGRIDWWSAPDNRARAERLTA